MVISKQFSKEQCSVGLKVALRIIDKWQASPRQACRILRISQSTFRRVNQGRNAGGRLDIDQQERIGLVIGIHATLRTVFRDQLNVHSFPGLKNDNTFFDGRSPLDVMSHGDIISIYETFKRIQQLEWLDQ
ncbi:antitoxin Xre-like helix-turn-helix domain-containing protein [Pseudomonas sp. SID14000]|uniref:antitoxin Xre-like helix-turn-helix domain-containing protein n=1 Tax=Pseudomonas sp. SID14000 TaxID=1986221 RepID=UPI000B3C031B|nr:antitoxin Xre-like helix-turn-helix domain-containing protein [Pseudomonas sp. SID14000]